MSEIQEKIRKFLKELRDMQKGLPSQEHILNGERKSGNMDKELKELYGGQHITQMQRKEEKGIARIVHS